MIGICFKVQPQTTQAFPNQREDTLLKPLPLAVAPGRAIATSAHFMSDFTIVKHE